MMNGEFLRSLLYPIGLFAHLFFTLRFFSQWIKSERKKISHVTKSFWILSLYGNVLMAIHGLIQLQYPISIIQVLNGAIAWRNLDLMKKNPRSFLQTLLIMALVFGLVSAFFLVQGFFFHSFIWMRSPTFFNALKGIDHLSFFWHLLGFLAMVLFASRFWMQWWFAEKRKESFLGKTFWWTSLIGGFLSLLYFIRLHDLINILGYSLGLIPYLRNLMLTKRESILPKSEDGKKKIFIFAGEHSGDLLGSQLVHSLKNESDVLLTGVGGPLMKNEGVELIADLRSFQVMGFTDVLIALPRLYKAFRQIKTHILKENPSAVVFIDYPDFNMKMASHLRKNGYRGKLIHYVCPSVWAWRKNRVHQLARTLDLLITVLPFEEKYFKETKLAICYAGHPLIHTVGLHSYNSEWKDKLGLMREKPLLALFPGSRKHEIEANLPLQLRAIKPFEKTHNIAISLAHPDLEKTVRRYVQENHPLVPQHYRYELMKEAKAALATSGTIILELGLHGTPTIATYKVNFFNAFIARCILRIRLRFYTLVNIICQKEIFPEFIHWKLSPEQISKKLENLLINQKEYQIQCLELRTLLGNKNASVEAAKAIYELTLHKNDLTGRKNE